MIEPADIKELASAASTQARAANRYWLTLMTVVLFALFHKDSGPAATVELPPGFGSVAASSFLPVLFLLICVLIVAFAAAHAQQVRAQKLARRHMNGDEKGQELFDMLCEPSVVRVAPLSQSARAGWQFFETAEGCPPWLIEATAAYYAVLKLAAVLVYFIVPLVTLWLVYARVHGRSSLYFLPAFLAAACLLQVTFGEILDGYRIWKVIRLPKTPRRKQD